MGMVDSQSCSSSNWAGMDGIGDEKEKIAKVPKLVPTCWGFFEVYSYLEPNIHTPKKLFSRSLVSCLLWWRWPPFSPNCKMSCHQGEIQTLLHWKSDAIYACYGSCWRRRVFFLARLKGRKIFGLCFLCLNCDVQDLGGILGFWRVENLEFLQNLGICRCERTILPGCLI